MFEIDLGDHSKYRRLKFLHVGLLRAQKKKYFKKLFEAYQMSIVEDDPKQTPGYAIFTLQLHVHFGTTLFKYLINFHNPTANSTFPSGSTTLSGHAIPAP